MTTVYRPVPIETAEQAAQLPDGAIARSTVGTFLEKGRYDRWWNGSYQRPHPGVVGWTALVPIEARYQEGSHRIDPDVDGAPSPSAHRLVTPWEDDG